MFYIKCESVTSNHGNPQARAFPGSVALPDSLLGDYIATMGFANLTLDGDTVTCVEINQEAYDDYKATHPDVPPAPPEATADEILDALLGVLE